MIIDKIMVIQKKYMQKNVRILETTCIWANVLNLAHLFHDYTKYCILG